MTVDGTGSTWSVGSAGLDIGLYGGKGTLNITGGGAVKRRRFRSTASRCWRSTSAAAVRSTLAVTVLLARSQLGGKVRILAAAGSRRAMSIRQSPPAIGSAAEPIKRSAERGTQPAISLPPRRSKRACRGRRFRSICSTSSASWLAIARAAWSVGASFLARQPPRR